jgi:hypothetical protein
MAGVSQQPEELQFDPRPMQAKEKKDTYQKKNRKGGDKIQKAGEKRKRRKEEANKLELEHHRPNPEVNPLPGVSYPPTPRPGLGGELLPGIYTGCVIVFLLETLCLLLQLKCRIRHGMILIG